MERMSSDQLKSLYASNQTLFFELANKWYKDDSDYYKEYVYPVILQNQNIVSSPKKSNSKLIGILILIVLVLFVVFKVFNAVTKKSDLQKSQEASYTISSDELFNEYHSNEVSADKKYKGKLIRIQGSIQDISKDFTGNVIVGISTSNQFMPIRCKINKKYESKAAGLTKGNTTTIIGDCDGMVIGSVYLDDCIILVP